MDKSGMLGIVITISCLLMFFVALFAPWFLINHLDMDRSEYNEDTEDTEKYELKYKMNSYDYSGKGYGENKDDELAKQFFEFESLDNGKLQGFIGIILGIILGISLIVIGNIHPVGVLSRRVMVFFRGVMGLLILLPGTFLLICGSKFTGVSIGCTTSTIGEAEDFVLCLVPLILLIVGLLISFFGFVIISHNFGKLEDMRGTTDVPVGRINEQFSNKFKKLSTFLVIFGIIALTTLPLLPIVSGNSKIDIPVEEDKLDFKIASAGLLNEDFMDEVDFANYLGWLNFAFWFIFAFSLFALFASLFLESGISDITGCILGLASNLIVFFIILALIIKILFIVDVSTGEYPLGLPTIGGGYIDGETGNFIPLETISLENPDLWYGYNYLPSLALIGLMIVCIIFMVHTIKGSATYFGSRRKQAVQPPLTGNGRLSLRHERYSGMDRRGYPPSQRNDYYGDRWGRDYPPSQRDDYYDDRWRRDYPPSQRDNYYNDRWKRDSPPPRDDNYQQNYRDYQEELPYGEYQHQDSAGYKKNPFMVAPKSRTPPKIVEKH